MRLGINYVPKHDSPEEWAEILAQRGYHAACFPVNYKSDVHIIDAYVRAAKSRDITIAEVGVWNSPFYPDKAIAQQARVTCEEQFRLADYIRACCCVNISGAMGKVWNGCYQENFSQDIYDKNVAFIQSLCDKVKPKYSCYTLEPMQWMVPDSPEQYLQIIKDVDREGFLVHMDVVNFVKDPYTYTHLQELMEKSFDLLGSYTKSCHVKDFSMLNNRSVSIHEVPVGEGCMDFLTYFDYIDRLDKDMPVLIEHQSDMAAYDQANTYLGNLINQNLY